MCEPNNVPPPIAQFNQSSSTLIVCVCFRLKIITGLKVDSHHLHPRLIYNSLIRSAFCRMVDECG